MIGPTAALLAALSVAASPKGEKQSWDSTVVPYVRADFLPHSTLVEVDGQAQEGRGFVQLDLRDPRRTFKVRVSAEGFEPEERTVEAGRVADKQLYLALRPAGFAQKVDPAEPSGMALAASALWKAGRVDDAADYADQSLHVGNTPLANHVLGDVWRRRGDRDKAVRYYTMYLSIAKDPPDGPEIRAYLTEAQPGDITVPAR
jgi:hypothetical protein